MIIKLFEIRDRATCVPAMAVKVSSADGPIIRRAGYGEVGSVLLTMLAHPRTEYDPYAWSSARTMTTAHVYIEAHWDELVDGQVIDVRVLLGETSEPAPAECV